MNKALTGEGPAMASGNQVCRGSWADLPTAPASRSSAELTAMVEPTAPLNGRLMHKLLNFERAKSFKQQKKAYNKSNVADSGHYEGFDGRSHVFPVHGTKSR